MVCGRRFGGTTLSATSKIVTVQAANRIGRTVETRLGVRSGEARSMRDVLVSPMRVVARQLDSISVDAYLRRLADSIARLILGSKLLGGRIAPSTAAQRKSTLTSQARKPSQAMVSTPPIMIVNSPGQPLCHTLTPGLASTCVSFLVIWLRSVCIGGTPTHFHPPGTCLADASACHPAADAS